jgi:hypothetical protein
LVFLLGVETGQVDVEAVEAGVEPGPRLGAQVCGGDVITIAEMCAAFEATAGQNLSQVKQDCANAPINMENGNHDSRQCVVDLQVAAEKSNNNKYSQQQAYDACDPNSGITVPNGSTTPLNADHSSLTP